MFCINKLTFFHFLKTFFRRHKPGNTNDVFLIRGYIISGSRRVNLLVCVKVAVNIYRIAALLEYRLTDSTQPSLMIARSVLNRPSTPVP